MILDAELATATREAEGLAQSQLESIEAGAKRERAHAEVVDIYLLFIEP